MMIHLIMTNLCLRLDQNVIYVIFWLQAGFTGELIKGVESSLSIFTALILTR